MSYAKIKEWPLGFVTCGVHPKTRCCWRCDKCPKCDGVKIKRGDYCEECTAIIKSQGGVWSPDCQDYTKPTTLFADIINQEQGDA